MHRIIWNTGPSTGSKAPSPGFCPFKSGWLFTLVAPLDQEQNSSDLLLPLLLIYRSQKISTVTWTLTSSKGSCALTHPQLTHRVRQGLQCSQSPTPPQTSTWSSRYVMVDIRVVVTLSVRLGCFLLGNSSLSSNFCLDTRETRVGGPTALGCDPDCAVRNFVVFCDSSFLRLSSSSVL